MKNKTMNGRRIVSTGIIAVFFMLAGCTTTKFKAGFALDPNTINALDGYTVATDVLREEERGVMGMQRQIEMIKGNSRLRLDIGLTQDPILKIENILRHFTTSSSHIAFEHRSVNGRSLGIEIGDVVYVSNGSSNKSILGEIIFFRSNIFISIVELPTQPPAGDMFSLSVNLKPIALEIDAQIQSLPDHSVQELRALLPVIAEFSIAENVELEPGDRIDLTLSVSDPRGLPLTILHTGRDGDVLTEGPMQYQAGSKVGTHTLTVVVVNDHLLYSEDTLSIDVRDR